MTLHIHTEVVSEFQQNARVLIDDSTQKSMIIDPGAEVEKLIDIVDTSINQIESIYFTHCHIDHCGGAIELLELIQQQKLPKPTLYYHSKDYPIAENIENQALMFGVFGSKYKNPPKPDILLDDCNAVKCGKVSLSCLYTPGHAPGHVALYTDYDDVKLHGAYTEEINNRPVLIAGDALFYNGIGRTDLPLANYAELIDSIKEKLFTLPDETVVLTGHGPNTTIGREKKYNPFIFS